MCTDFNSVYRVIVSAGLVIMMGSASTLAMQAVLPHLDECAQGCYFTAVNCMGDALAMLENQHQFHVLAACDLDEEACAAACGNVGSHTGVTANADAKVGCVWAQMLDGDECTCGPDGNQVGDTISCNDGSLTLWGGENEGHPTCVGVSFCTPWVQDNMRIIVGASIGGLCLIGCLVFALYSCAKKQTRAYAEAMAARNGGAQAAEQEWGQQQNAADGCCCGLCDNCGWNCCDYGNGACFGHIKGEHAPTISQGGWSATNRSAYGI